VSLELHMESVRRTIGKRKRALFSELFEAGAPPEIVVVTFLAILELYKRGRIDVKQSGVFGEIEVLEIEPDEEDQER
jgi:segregation and condensation protein A